MGNLFSGAFDQNIFNEGMLTPKLRVFSLSAGDGSIDVGETINSLHAVIQSVDGVYSANGTTGSVVDGTTTSQINFDAPVTADAKAIVFYD